jgi:hypothetical protein
MLLFLRPGVGVPVESAHSDTITEITTITPKQPKQPVQPFWTAF